MPSNGAAGWWDWHDEGRWHAGGQTITLRAPLERCPLLVRGGSLVVLAESAQAAATAHSRVRILRAFPHPPDAATAATSPVASLTWVEDDGTTAERTTAAADGVGAANEHDRAVISCELHCARDALRLCARIVLFGNGSTWRPGFRTIQVQLPPSESRTLEIEQECWEGGKQCDTVRVVYSQL